MRKGQPTQFSLPPYPSFSFPYPPLCQTLWQRSVPGAVGIAGECTCAWKKRTEERKNTHGKLTKGMMSVHSGKLSRSLSWAQEGREYQANWSRDVWASRLQCGRLAEDQAAEVKRTKAWTTLCAMPGVGTTKWLQAIGFLFLFQRDHSAVMQIQLAGNKDWPGDKLGAAGRSDQKTRGVGWQNREEQIQKTVDKLASESKDKEKSG